MLGMEMLPSTAQELANKAEEDGLTAHPGEVYRPRPGETKSEVFEDTLERASSSDATAMELAAAHAETAAEEERPPIDLFKAIFLDSEEEPVSEVEEEVEEAVSAPVDKMIGCSAEPDADSLLRGKLRNIWTDAAEESEGRIKSEESKTKHSRWSTDPPKMLFRKPEKKEEPDQFGPSLPPADSSGPGNRKTTCV